MDSPKRDALLESPSEPWRAAYAAPALVRHGPVQGATFGGSAGAAEAGAAGGFDLIQTGG